MAKRRERWTAELVRSAVKQAWSIAGALRHLGLPAVGGNYARMHQAIREHELDTSHWTGKGHLRGKCNPHVKRLDLASVLVPNSNYNSNRLRKRLIREGWVSPACSSCGRTEWIDQPIPLELDHIDGDRTNNTFTNLRLVCPNCHALTPTYRGRNVARRRQRGALSVDNG